MNVALLISGALRSYQRCLPSLANHIVASNPEHKVDTYINVWDDTLNYVGFNNEECCAEFVDLSKIYEHKQSLNIKKVSIETYKDSEIVKSIESQLHTTYKNGEGGMQHNSRNSLLFYHRLMETNNMKFSATGYDVVIRCRPDLMFHSKLDLENIEDNTVYFPHINCYGPGMCNDQFYLGKTDVMDKIFGVFNNAETIANGFGTLHPESILYFQILHHGITINKRTIEYHIER